MHTPISTIYPICAHHHSSAASLFANAADEHGYGSAARCPGHAVARFELGRRHALGDGAALDPREAARLYGLAAAQGYAVALAARWAIATAPASGWRATH